MMTDSQRICDNIMAIPSELTKGRLSSLFLCLFLSLFCLFLLLLRLFLSLLCLFLSLLCLFLSLLCLFLSLLCLFLFPLSLQKEYFIICKIVAGHRVRKACVKECYCQFD